MDGSGSGTAVAVAGGLGAGISLLGFEGGDCAMKVDHTVSLVEGC